MPKNADGKETTKVAATKNRQRQTDQRVFGECGVLSNGDIIEAMN